MEDGIETYMSILLDNKYMANQSVPKQSSLTTSNIIPNIIPNSTSEQSTTDNIIKPINK
jgi:hypothetical protein